MISKAYILKELKKLEILFDRASRSSDTDLQKFYSKLTLLELCGWIEQSMDDVVARSKKKLKDNKNINLVDKIIKYNSSFRYWNLKMMLVKTIGILRVEQIEKRLDVNKKILFESSLSNLKKIRDEHAHKYIYGTTTKLYAPSFTISHFGKVYNGLKELERQLIKG